MLISYLSIILCVLLLLGLALGALFKNLYTAEKEMELKRECEDLAQSVSELYGNPAWRAVADERLVNSARRFDALIQLRFVDTSMPKASFFDEASRQKWELCDEVDLSGDMENVLKLEGVFKVENIFKDIVEYPTLTLRKAFILDESTPDGVLYIHFDLSDVYTTLNDVYLEMILAMLVAVLICAFAVLYFTGTMTKPISLMNQTVMRYTKGEFSARVSVSGEDEVAQLGRSFNIMADELNGLEQARRNFVANVSHELRSPLTAMRGFLQAMLDGVIEKEEYEKYIKVVLDENIRMTNMVNDLLDLAKIESGKEPLNITIFDINELISRTVLTFEAVLDKKKIEIDVEFEPRLYVKADEQKITQVLHNLMHNAIKFTSEGGKITLTTRSDERLVFVTVSDTGCGMDAEDARRIFDRFYKAEKAHTPSNTSGTGLGLSIAKRIVDAHGQSIGVESEKGKGSAFTVTLTKARRPRQTNMRLSQ